MALQLDSVKLPRGTWVDLYAETGITVGVKLSIQNIGANSARLVESATQPTTNNGYNVVTENQYATNKTGAIGAWAYSNGGTILQVEEN